MMFVDPLIPSSSEPGASAESGMPGRADLWDGDTVRSPAEVSSVHRGGLFLRRNALLIGTVGLIVALFAFGAAILVFNKYPATALILIDPRDAKVTQVPQVLSNIGPDSIAIESLVQVANSDGFLGRVIDALDLTVDPEFQTSGAVEADRRARTIEKLKAAVRVDRRGMTYVIEATASTKDGAKSAKIANKVADMIVDDQSRLRFGSNEKAAAWIADHIDEMRDQLRKTEDASAALKAKLKITDAGQGFTLQERLVSELNQQAVLASARTAETQARYNQLRAAGVLTPDRLPASVQSSVLSSLREDYAKLTRQAAEQAVTFGDRYPAVQGLRAQVGDVRKQIAAEIGRLISSAKSDFTEAKAREASLAQQVRGAQNDSGEIGRQIVKLDEIDREAKAQRSVYEQMLTRQKELTELQNLQPNDFRIVSPAVTPIRTNMPKSPIIAIACTVLGIVSGLGAAVLIESMRRTISRPSQAERLSGLPVVGLVPEIKGLAKRLETAWFDEQLCAWLSDLSILGLPQPGGGSRVILVTSPRPGEGKSTVAAHLASCLARANNSVLLIEGRIPESGRIQRPGLLDVLRRRASLQRVLVDHPSEKFSLLPFGNDVGVDPQTIGALLGGPRLVDAIQGCRDLYQTVIIDGPAVMDAAHTRGLAAAADLTILVIEWDVTDEAFLPYVIDRLNPKAGAIVFNKVNLKRYALLEPFLPGFLERRSTGAAWRAA